MAKYPLTPERRPGESNEKWAERLEITPSDEFWEEYDGLMRDIADIRDTIIPELEAQIGLINDDIDDLNERVSAIETQ